MKLSILILPSNLRLCVIFFALGFTISPMCAPHPSHFVFLISQPAKQIAQFFA